MTKDKYEQLEFETIQKLNDQYFKVDDTSGLHSWDINARMYRFSKEVDDFHRQAALDIIAEDEIVLWGTRYRMAKKAFMWASRCNDVSDGMKPIWGTEDASTRWGKALGKIRKKYAEVRALHKCQQQLHADAAAISKWFANMTASEIECAYELD